MHCVIELAPKTEDHEPILQEVQEEELMKDDHVPTPQLLQESIEVA